MKEKIWFILEGFEGDSKISLSQQCLTLLDDSKEIAFAIL